MGAQQGYGKTIYAKSKYVQNPDCNEVVKIFLEKDDNKFYYKKNNGSVFPLIGDVAIPIIEGVIPMGTGPSITNGEWGFSGNDIFPLIAESNIGNDSKRVGYLFTSLGIDYVGDLVFSKSGNIKASLNSNGYFGINVDALGMLHTKGNTNDAFNYSFIVDNSDDLTVLSARNDGQLIAPFTYGILSASLNNGLLAINEDGSIYNSGVNVNDLGNYWKRNGNVVGGSDFIGTTNAQALVFKTFNTESARITSAGSWGFGTVTPGGKVHIKGQDSTSGNYALKVYNSSNDILFNVRNDGVFFVNSIIDGSGTGVSNITFSVASGGYRVSYQSFSQTYLDFYTNSLRKSYIVESGGYMNTSVSGIYSIYDINTGQNKLSVDMTNNGNVAIGDGYFLPSAKLQVKGTDSTSSNYALKVNNSVSSPLLYVRNDGYSSFNGVSNSIGSVEAHGVNLHGFVSVTTGVDNIYSGLGVTDGAVWFFRVNKSGEMQINSSQNSFLIGNGNLGIGTTSPNTKLDIDGDISTRADVVINIVANTNDLSTSNRSYVKLSNTTGGALDITGFDNGYEGKRLVVANVGADTLHINNEDVASVAKNRIITGNPGSTNIIKFNDTLELIYDSTVSRWRVINHGA